MGILIGSAVAGAGCQRTPATECAAGAEGCSCQDSAPCASGLACIAGLCRACPVGTAGCPCDANNACSQLICDHGTCRAAKSCQDVACTAPATCLDRGTTADAVCAQPCDAGDYWNAEHSACEPDPKATCESGTPSSILASCDKQHRVCVTDPAGAHCGDCQPGYVPGASNQCSATSCATLQAQCDQLYQECGVQSGVATCQGCKPGYLFDPKTLLCRPQITCATLQPPCPGGQICIEDPAGDATCTARSCPPCDQPGEDGAWPNPTQQGKCICKTKPGYFYSLSGSIGTFPCDADHDGCVRITARYAIESDDQAIKDNARCELRWVHRFILRNEYKHDRIVELDAPLPLYETVRNDDQQILDNVSPPGAWSSTAPAYGSLRTLRAAELNSLTKACVSGHADFNDNKIPDIEEWGRPKVGQHDLPSDIRADERPLFETYTQFSYFVELHKGWFDTTHPGTFDNPGAYIIAERIRRIDKNDHFALRYGLEPESTQYTSDYWQDCRRDRDSWYTDSAPTIGMDFASESPPSETWEGMMHHSQFKCIQVANEKDYKDRGQNLQLQSIAALGDRNPLTPLPPGMAGDGDFLHATINTCSLSSDTGTPEAQGNPRDPVLTCTVSLPTDVPAPDPGSVRWAAVRIIQSSKYYRGCMIQCAGTKSICPGTPPGGAPAPCYSVCSVPTASKGPAQLSAGGYSLRGEVPLAPLALPKTPDLRLSNSTSGYSIQPR